MTAHKREYLYIKNMAGNGCIQSIREEAVKAGLKIKSLRPGSLVLLEKCTKEQLRQFEMEIGRCGFKLLSNKRERVIEAIKTEIINTLQYDGLTPGNQNFSGYLSSILGQDYSYLSSLFSSSEKTTIEKYIILQKVERTKDLLCQNELTLTEIANKLGYSNTQHLSAQFKKATGMSPSQYRKQKAITPKQ